MSNRKFVRETQILRQYLGETLWNTARHSKAILAGGAARAVFAREPIKDLDFYFPTSLQGYSFENLIKAALPFRQLSNTINAVTIKVEGEDHPDNQKNLRIPRRDS